MSNCIEGTLAPYIPSTDVPWNKTRVKHLYNRLGNGANISEVNNGLLQNPSDLVDAMIDEALVAPLPSPEYFSWAEYPNLSQITNQPFSEFGHDDRRYQLGRHFASGQILHPVKFKLAVFWSGHFVTENGNDIGDICQVYLYYRLIHQYTLGNLKEFTEKVGLTPRMLFYLNGRENKASNPNENYARELLELFTIGEGNYSQDDIENIARGLTGWYAGNRYNDYLAGEFVLQPDQYVLHADDHDWTPITLFGETFTPSIPSNDQEAFDFAYEEYQWIINTIFTKKEEVLAKFICRKLYKFYVYEIPNEDIIAEMATIFIDNNWEIVPVLRALFKSEHFFNEQAFGIQIKSPIEIHANYVRKTGYIYNVHWYSEQWADNPLYDPNQPYINGKLPYTTYNYAHWWWSQAPGQQLLNPPNVAGWPGGRNWINESVMVQRWQSAIPIFNVLLGSPGWSNPDLVDVDGLRQHIRNFMIELTDNSTDVEFVVREIIDHYFILPLEEELIVGAVNAFKGTFYPASYYANGTWNLSLTNTWNQFRYLMEYLVRLPEFQLV